MAKCKVARSKAPFKAKGDSSREVPFEVEPLVAYDLGGLLNQFEWHFQQAWLLNSRSQGAEVVRLLLAISNRVRDAVPTKLKRSCQQSILEHVEAWKAQFGSEDHHEQLLNAEDELNNPNPLGDLDEQREEVFRRAFPSPWIDELREYIADLVPGDKRVWLELGDLVDQGVRRSKVYRFLIDEERPEVVEPSLKSTKERTEIDEERRLPPPEVPQFDLSRPLETLKSSLAHHIRNVGEVLPEDGWLEWVSQLWKEAGITAVLPQLDPGMMAPEPDVVATSQEPNPGMKAQEPDVGTTTQKPVPGTTNQKAEQAFMHLVSRMDSAIRADVGAVATTKRKSVRNARPPRIDLESQTVQFDTKTYSDIDPEALVVFAKIVEAKGRKVKGKELNALPGCKGRVDRLLKKLPKALQALIDSKPGKGGGYWLHLRPESSP